MTVSPKEIAERAGVSTATVRQIFNGRAHRFSEKTQAKIRALAEELGYRPNAAARSVSRGRFDAVGILLRHGGRHQDHNILKGVYEAARNCGMSVNYGEVDDTEFEDSERLPRLLKERCVDGLIVHHGRELDAEVTERFSQLHVPIVWVNANVPCDCVRPDDEGAVNQAVHEIAAKGHKRIGWINCEIHANRRRQHSSLFSSHYSSTIREEAFRQGCREVGASQRILVDTVSSLDAMVRIIAGFFSKPNAPTAVISNSPIFTSDLIVAAQQANISLSLPQIAVAFASEPYRPFTGIETYNLSVPAYQMGLEAVDMLREKIKQKGRSIPVLRVSYPPLNNGQTRSLICGDAITANKKE